MFHETRFPTAISRAAHGGPERRTDVVVLGSGAEERNARWADSRRSYNAGYGVKSLDDLHAVIAFFEERRGRLHGFRWRDPADCKSCPPEDARRPRSISRSAPATAPPPPSSSQDLRRRLQPLDRATSPSRSPAPCWSPSPASCRRAGTAYTVDHRHRHRHLPRRPRPRRRRRRHRRLRVRRARALRHRQARDQPPGLPPRRHPSHPHRRDPGVSARRYEGTASDQPLPPYDPIRHCPPMKSLPQPSRRTSPAAPPRWPGAGA